MAGMFNERRSAMSLVAAAALLGMMTAGCSESSRLAAGSCQQATGATQVAVTVRNNLNIPLTFHAPTSTFAADDWLCGESPHLWDDAELKPGQTQQFTLTRDPRPSVGAIERPGAFSLDISSEGRKVTSFKYAVDVVDGAGRQYIQLADRSEYDCSRQNTRLFLYGGTPIQARINCQGDLVMTFEYPVTLAP